MTERRFTAAPGTTVAGQASTQAGGKQITGHAAVFNEWTTIAGEFEERIAPGAFADTLLAVRFDTVGLFNHNPDVVLGRRSTGTLRMKEDGRGLHFTIDVNDADQSARDLFARVRRRDVTGCSFSFAIDEEDWVFPKGRLPQRTILRVARLFDVGPVTMPAYDATSVTTFEPADAQRAWEHSRARLRFYEKTA